MKKPLLNQIERYALRMGDSVWAKRLELYLAQTHLNRVIKRELKQTTVGKFFRGIVEWLSKVLPRANQ